MEPEMRAQPVPARVGRDGHEMMLRPGRHDHRHARRDMLSIVGAKGGKSSVTIGDVNQRNGVIHLVDSVLIPG